MASGSIKQLPDGRYRVRWRTPDGRQPGRTFRTKKLADAFLRTTLTDIEEHGIVGTSRGETISTMFTDWWAGLSDSLRHDSLVNYRRNREIIEEKWGGTPLNRVDYGFVQTVVNQLSDDGYAPKTVAAIYSILNLALTDAHLRGKIRQLPKPRMPHVDAPDLVIPTRHDVERLADAIRLDLRAAVILAGYTGLRQGEVLGLERHNLHLDEGRIRISQAANQKTGKSQTTKTKASKRWVVLPDRADTILRWHLDEIADPTVERLFPVTASTLDKAWRDARTRCNLDRVRFHDLRHSAASMYIAAGVNIMQVQRQLGHARPSMTLDVYGWLYPESSSDALEKVNTYLDHDATSP